MELAFSALAAGAGALTGAPMNLLAGTVASSAATGGSTMLSVLQGAMGLGSALSAIGKGQAEAGSYRMQAFGAEAEARQEQAAGLQRTTTMKRELAKVLGESDVAYAAGGVDLGGGVAAEARQTAKSRAAAEMSVDRSLTDARIAMQLAKAAGYRRLAGAAEASGWIGGLTTGLSTGFDIKKRG
jgi:hypothetical protein